ncbi:MAG: hypothetical protein ACRYG2_00365 [Janthinobacterium lividum]
MNTLATLLLLALGIVCLGIPLAAVAIVYRDAILPAWDQVRRALAFDPRHPALDYHFGR